MPSSDAPLKLYRHPLSGHCHRVELLLGLAALEHERVEVNLAKREQKQEEFLALNPFGQIPVLVHGELVLADSNAILIYLAERFPTAASYLPRDPEGRARVQRWLSVAAGPLAYGPAAARRARVFRATIDLESVFASTRALFTVLESELAGRDFLVGKAPTLAELALYAYTARAPEGGVSLDEYPSIRAWLARIEGLPRFVPMAHAPV